MSSRLFPFCCAVLLASTAAAQDLEPRAFSQTPVGMNFALLSWGYTGGDLSFDQSVPIEDATGRIQLATAGYVRSFGLLGKSAKLAALVPFGFGDWEGEVGGEQESTTRTGFLDPAVQLAVNLIGAPALAMGDMPRYRESTVVGLALLASAPLGQYDPAKLINLGANRWSLRPRVGISQRLGKWHVEALGGVRLFADNNDFFGGKTVTQDPLWTLTIDGVRQFRRGFWLSLGWAVTDGGQTTVDGITGDTHQHNHQVGAILAYPLGPRHSLKLMYINGLSTRIGADFDNVSLAWQMRWGGGS